MRFGPMNDFDFAAMASAYCITTKEFKVDYINPGGAEKTCLGQVQPWRVEDTSATNLHLHYKRDLRRHYLYCITSLL